MDPGDPRNKPEGRQAPERQRCALWVASSDGPTQRGSGVAIGVRGAVAALEAHLVRAMRLWPFDEELVVEADTSGRIGVELHHPTLDAIGIKLRIDGTVERVGEIHAPPVAADLH